MPTPNRSALVVAALAEVAAAAAFVIARSEAVAETENCSELEDTAGLESVVAPEDVVEAVGADATAFASTPGESDKDLLHYFGLAAGSLPVAVVRKTEHIDRTAGPAVHRLAEAEDAFG